MSETTGIGWCDSTKGPWLICTEVSPGCGHCYARELMLNRLKVIARKAYKSAGFADWETRPLWGNAAPRILTRDFRKQMLAMNRKPFICDGCGNAYLNKPDRPERCKCGSVEFHRRRSFPSLIDWLDEMPAGIIDQDGNKLDPTAVLADFLDTLRQCDQMIHILCTKRPENWRDRLQKVVESLSPEPGLRSPCLPDDEPVNFEEWLNWWLSGNVTPKNIILLTSVENQQEADKRIPELLRIPAACRGLSLEPLLGPVDLRAFIPAGAETDNVKFPAGFVRWAESRREEWIQAMARATYIARCDIGLHWLIAGGESGASARPCNVEWIRSLVAQGQAAGTATFVKQLGAMPVCEPHITDKPFIFPLADKKGGDPAEWPDDLRVQEWPRGF